MKKVSQHTLIALLIILIFLNSCANYQIEDKLPLDFNPESSVTTLCDPDTVYFGNSILPLVVSSCATTGCHNERSHRDGIILTDYNTILTTGKIKPGDPNDSEFF